MRNARTWFAGCLAGLVLAAVAAAPQVLAQSVPLTPEEQAWLRAHPAITVALDQFNPPMAFRRADADAQTAPDAAFSGACVEYAQLAARNAGITLRYTGSTWDEALRKGMAHEVDGVLCARERPERKTRLNFSTPYLELPIAMATRNGHPTARSLAAFSGKRVAVVKNTVRIPVLRVRCPDCVLLEVDSVKDGITAVASGRADGYFDDLPVIQRGMADVGSQLKIGLLYYYSEAAAVRIALRNDQPELLSLINKGLAAITPAEHELIRSRWLSAADGAQVQRDLPLSPEQRAWLAAHPVLKVAMDGGRAPIEWRGEDGVQRGISVDFLQKMEDMLGVRIQMVPSKSVADQLDKLQRKEVDIVSAITQSPERRSYMSVTDAILTTPIVIFTRVGTPPPGGLGGLAGKRVGVSARTNVEAMLKREWPAIATVPTDNFAQAADMLRKGTIDAFIGPLLTGTHQLVEQGATDIRVAGETDLQYHIGYGVRNDLPELLPILNLALAAIPRAERDAVRQKWSTVQFAHEMDYRPLGALLVAVLVAVVFIVQLRVMVKRRTAELRHEVTMRRAREDEIQLLNAALELRVEHRTEQLSKANADLRMAAEQLVQTEKVASLGRLVAGIAHELNTPLGSSLTAATSLRDIVREFGRALTSGGLRRSQAEEFVKQCEHACGIIERNAYRASGLIDNFKEIAVDQASVRRRRFGLKHLVEEVLSTHHNAWKNTPHRVETDIPADIELDSFPGPLAQVLSNLLENTLVHGFAQHAGGVAQISAVLQGERVLLTYADNGAGIPAEYRNKVYDPFFTTRMGQGGSGLGLYIVQNLVTGVLGGGIVLHSEDGQGTRFDMSLPLVAPEPTASTASAAHGIVPLPENAG